MPYVVILLKCLAEYRKRQASSTSASTSLVPKTSQERAHFKDLIRESMALKPLSEPENFEEALNAAYRVSSPTSVKKKQQTKQVSILKYWMINLSKSLQPLPFFFQLDLFKSPPNSRSSQLQSPDTQITPLLDHGASTC